MKERPMLYSGAMVRAILAGQKTQTRRILRLRPGFDIEQRDDGRWWPWAEHPDRADDVWQPAPSGDIGDRIYVRETFSHFERNEDFKDGCECFYRADGDCVDLRPWRPAIHMPKWAARIWLEITDVRAERLQSITEAASFAEGATGGHGVIPGYAYSATPLEHFRYIWETTGGNWAANPWVWVTEFKTISTTGRPT